MKQSIRQPLTTIVIGIIALSLFFSIKSFSGSADKSEQWTAPSRASQRKNPVSPDANSVAAGKTVYIKECLSCHGSTGKGDGSAAKDLTKSPGDLSNPKMWEQTDGALFWKITTGKSPMATYEKLLTEQQRWNVVNYTRTLAPRPSEKKTSSDKGDSK
jgi:mono/diheme cytochrome c family protein